MGAAGGPMDLVALAQTTRLASQELARSSGASRNRALEELARYLEARWDELLGINCERSWGWNLLERLGRSWVWDPSARVELIWAGRSG